MATDADDDDAGDDDDDTWTERGSEAVFETDPNETP